MKLSHIIEISLFVGIIGAILFTTNLTWAQNPAPFCVWEKVGPICVETRQDWFAVGQDNPGGAGSGYWVLAGSEINPPSCFPTFAAAAAAADVAKMGIRFDSPAVCCKVYGVWQNTNTTGMSVARLSEPPPMVEGWIPFGPPGPLCCEEAFIVAFGGTFGVNPDCRCFTLSTGVTVCDPPAATFVPFVPNMVVAKNQSGPGPGPGPGHNLSGAWCDSKGNPPVILTQNGSDVTGSYHGGSGHESMTGTIQGVFDGTTLRCRFRNHENGVTGTGTCYFTLSGNQLSGRWEQSGHSGEWNLTRCDGGRSTGGGAPKDIDYFSGSWVAFVTIDRDRSKFELSLSRTGPKEWQGTLTGTWLDWHKDPGHPPPPSSHAIRLVQDQVPTSAKVFEDGNDYGNHCIYSKSDETLHCSYGTFKRR